MGREPEASADGMRKKKIWYWAAAILLFAGILWLGAAYMEGKKYRLPEAVILGDSIFAKMNQYAVSDGLQEKTGLTVLNGAFGGTCMARRGDPAGLDDGKELLSMAALARSVASEDFLPQQSVRNAEGGAGYYEETVDRLDQVDFDGVKLLILQYGMNDYQGGIPVEDPEDPFSESTYAGALRTVLRTLRERYPEVRILLATPTYSWYPDRGETCEEFDPGGGILEDYVNKELEVAREYGVEILDMYHDFYPHGGMEDWKTYTRDGVHPNEAGVEKLSSAIADYLEEDP